MITTQSARTRWVEDVRIVVNQAKYWAAGQNWGTALRDVVLTEEGIGTYTADTLVIETESGTLTLEPIACRTPEADGRVDLTAYPSLSRVLLLRRLHAERTEWVVRTSEGLDWPQPWSEDTFLQIANGLLRTP